MAQDNAAKIVAKKDAELRQWLEEGCPSPRPEKLAGALGALGELAYAAHVSGPTVRAWQMGHLVYDWDVALSTGELVECKTSLVSRFRSAGWKNATHVARITLEADQSGIYATSIKQRPHPDPSPGVDPYRDLNVKRFKVFP